MLLPPRKFAWHHIVSEGRILRTVDIKRHDVLIDHSVWSKIWSFHGCEFSSRVHLWRRVVLRYDTNVSKVRGPLKPRRTRTLGLKFIRSRDVAYVVL